MSRTLNEPEEWLMSHMKGNELMLMFDENYDPQDHGNDIYKTIKVEDELRALIGTYPDLDINKHILIMNCEKIRERRAYINLISELST